jgi:uncharacterized protein YgbK (DUF1537 family)
VAPTRRVFALADDLSGAAEVAAALGMRRSRTEVLLATVDRGQVERADDAADLVVDLDTRSRGSHGSEEVVRRVRDATRHPDLLLLKVDSLLRGFPGAHLATLGEHGRVVVAAVALPVAARTICRGVLHVAGVPLHLTDAWRAEAAAPPRSVLEALAPTSTRVVDVAAVRGGRGDLARTLCTVSESGSVPVCDAETDADLDGVVAACLQIPDVCLVGSGGLAAAVGRALGPLASPAPPPTDRQWTDPRSVLVVAGSAEPLVARQRQVLLDRSLLRGERIGVVDTEVDALLGTATGGIVERAVRLLRDGQTCFLHLRSDGPLDRTRSADLVERLAAVSASAVRRVEDQTGAEGPLVGLALTGGETARRVLDALGVARLIPQQEIHHGAVRSLTPDGRAVVTRPGSFGDVDSLWQIVTSLRRKAHS